MDVERLIQDQVTANDTTSRILALRHARNRCLIQLMQTARARIGRFAFRYTARVATACVSARSQVKGTH
jgi:hypothetical protein